MSGHFFSFDFYDQTIIEIVSLMSLQVFNSAKPNFFNYSIRLFAKI